MGFRKKASWTPSDITTDREVSVSELQEKMASDFAAENEWAQSTWTIPNEEKLTDFAMSNRAIIDKGEGYPAITTNVTTVKNGVVGGEE